MKSVLRSIKPFWLYCTIIREKTIEVGKTFPKAEDWNREVFFYCSKDRESFDLIPEKDREWMRKYLGKVACRFVCDYHTDYTLDDYDNSYFISDDDLEATCLLTCELWEYGKGKTLYGWHISDLVIYDEPRELSEFQQCHKCKHSCVRTSQNVELCKYHRLSRPPQSWCYVEATDPRKTAD